MALALLATLLGVSTVFAAGAPALDCTIRFELSGWSAVYERVDGTGTLSCTDGTTLPVDVYARGPRLTAGRLQVTLAKGRFEAVQRISDVFGTYTQDDVYDDPPDAVASASLTNGKVSISIGGVNTAANLGITSLTIRP